MFIDTNTFAHACAYKYGNSNAHILVIQTHTYAKTYSTHMCTYANIHKMHINEKNISMHRNAGYYLYSCTNGSEHMQLNNEWSKIFKYTQKYGHTFTHMWIDTGSRKHTNSNTHL